LAGFADVAKVTTKTKRLDQTAISIVKANEEGWWVANIVHGRWGVQETARRIFQAVRDYQPVAVGIEKGALKNAVLPYLSDYMKKNQRFLGWMSLPTAIKRKPTGLFGLYKAGLNMVLFP